jgi:hypothetical protein
VKWLVEMHGEVRELYSVEADTEENAIEHWSDGVLVLSEASSMEIYSIREEEE